MDDYDRYFFVPVYEWGKYVMRVEGPAGWNFEPEERKVVVTEEENTCQEEIVFQFVAFQIAGSVKAPKAKSCRMSGGPAGVIVTLKKEEVEIEKVVTNKEGSFVFKSVLPSTYLLAAEHPTFKIVDPNQSFVVGWDNAKTVASVSITGYEITGKILHKDNSGASAVDVILLAKREIDKNLTLECNRNFSPLQLHPSLFPLCVTVANALGEYSFRDVPCGEFEVRAIFKRPQASFDFEPFVVTAVIDSESVSAPTMFVKSFTATGAVVDADGKGYSSAEISVNGNSIGLKTGQDGRYGLNGLTNSVYLLIANVSNVRFAQVSTEGLNSTTVVARQGFPLIRAAEYEICGIVASPVSKQRIIDVIVAETEEKLNDQSAKRSQMYVPI